MAAGPRAARAARHSPWARGAARPRLREAAGDSASSPADLTSDYIIAETDAQAYGSLDTSNYTLVYQSVYNGITLCNVYRRTA